MAKILVADDEPAVLAAFAAILSTRGHEVLTTGDAEEAIHRVEREDCDLVILDICLPRMSGLDALGRIKSLRPVLPVIVMTGRGTTDTAIEATKRGAFDYQLKPFEPQEMLETIAKALEAARLMKGQVDLGPETTETSTEAIVGRSPPCSRSISPSGGSLRPTSPCSFAEKPVRGRNWWRVQSISTACEADSPMTVVNCAAISETLLESELFGHERGAFTGAVARRIGKFEQAHGGTLFLDEIGDMSLATQSKVLRLLQERSFERLGSNETIQADVRVLCATNRNLERAIAEGTFRDDLYHRLNVVTLQIPPLRERREDIVSLIDYFLGRSARGLGVEKPPIAEDAIALLVNYLWPGNVRELQHLIQQLVIFSGGYTIQAADLPAVVRSGVPRTSAQSLPFTEEQWLPLIRSYLASYDGRAAHEELLDMIDKATDHRSITAIRGKSDSCCQTFGARTADIAR